MQAEQPASIANVAPVEMERDGAIASQSAQLDTSRLTILEKPDGTAEVAAASGREAAERERALQDQLDQVKQTLALTQQRLKAQEAEAEASKAATAQLQRELLSSQQQLKAAGVEMGKAATTREMSLRAERLRVVPHVEEDGDGAGDRRVPARHLGRGRPRPHRQPRTARAQPSHPRGRLGAHPRPGARSRTFAALQRASAVAPAPPPAPYRCQNPNPDPDP